MAIEIIGTGRAVPPKRVSNEELTTRVDTTDEWIRSHTGIGAKNIAAMDIITGCTGFIFLQQGQYPASRLNSEKKILFLRQLCRQL